MMSVGAQKNKHLCADMETYALSQCHFECPMYTSAFLRGGARQTQACAKLDTSNFVLLLALNLHF